MSTPALLCCVLPRPNVLSLTDRAGRAPTKEVPMTRKRTGSTAADTAPKTGSRRGAATGPSSEALDDGALASVQSDGGAFKGHALTEQLEKRRRVEGLELKQLAALLGVQPNHFSAMMGGRRWIGSVRDEVLVKIAQFLNVSKAVVYLWAEILQPSDFFPQDASELLVRRVGEQLVDDPSASGLVRSLSEWESWPDRSRFVIATFYTELQRWRALNAAGVIPGLEAEPEVTQPS